MSNPCARQTLRPMKRDARGQSTVEFAVLVAVVIAALIAMQIYMKRAVHGKLRESTDQIGTQYDPTVAKMEIDEGTNASTNETTFSNGAMTQGFQSVQQNRSGNETLTGNLANQIF